MKTAAMVKLTINGREVQARKGMTILEAAREHNIYIPTLCHHEEVTPYGACRLCMVEVTKNGRERLVASCLYEVAEGLKVKTDSERIAANRKMLMELLLARCPNNKAVQDLAHRLGVEKTSFKLDDNDCMLCALCVRVCQEVVGVSAISLVNRGVDRAIATPFFEDSNVCIGCGSCAYVCPVNAIKFEDIGDTRRITWPNNQMEFKLKKCSSCGRYFAPQAQLDYIIKQAGLAADAFDKCPDCRD